VSGEGDRSEVSRSLGEDLRRDRMHSGRPMQKGGPSTTHADRPRLRVATRRHARRTPQRYAVDRKACDRTEAGERARANHAYIRRSLASRA